MIDKSLREEAQAKLLQLMKLPAYSDETSVAAFIDCSQGAINKLRRHAACGQEIVDKVDVAWRRAGLGPSKDVEATVRYASDTFGVPIELAWEIARSSQGAKLDPLALLNAILSTYRLRA